jgi:hypothetical protein
MNKDELLEQGAALGVRTIAQPLSRPELWREYVNLLESASDESVSREEHWIREARLHGWLDGVRDALGLFFNGDQHYLPQFESGDIKERSLCVGQFINWASMVDRQYR